MKNILFLTRLDPNNLRSWSGINYFILKILKKHFSVTTVGPLSNRIRFFYVFIRFFYSILKIKFDIDRPILVAKDFAKQIEKKIKNIKYDAIITSDTYLVTFLKTSKPIFIYTDIDFYNYYKHYYKNINISSRTIVEGNLCEEISLKKAKKIILTSNWAIKNCSRYYKLPSNKFTRLPFGANLLSIPSTKKVHQYIKKKSRKVCNLISIGVHWNRKGMDKAVDLVNAINKKGQNCKLFIVGAKPPKNYTLSKKVIILNFLDKNKNKGNFSKLLSKMHFHVLFSKSEAFGVVNCEASAYGIYTATHNVGGISGAIIDHVNGFKFSKNTNIDFVANHLIKIFSNYKIFLAKSFSSRRHYEKALDWNIISSKIKQLIIK